MTTGSQVTGPKTSVSGCGPMEGAGNPVTCLHREDEGLPVVQRAVQFQHQGEHLTPADHQLRAGVLLGVVGSTIPQPLPVHLSDSDP